MRKIALCVAIFLLPALQSFAQNCFVSANLMNACASGCNFSVSIVVQGTNMPFNVTVIGPNSFVYGPAIVTSSIVLNNLCPGTYQITAVDNVGATCSQSSLVIPLMNPLVLSTQVTNATCSTCNDGSVVMTASGGTPPYVYNINGITTPFATNLSPGAYFASVTDANGCTDFDTLVIGVGTNGNYSLTGTVYLDINANGVYDSGEPGMANQIASINPPGTNMISSGLGGYGTIVPPGTYDISYVPSPGWSLSSTTSNYNVTVTSSSLSGLDFGIVPDSTTASGILSLGSGLPRCFWTVPYYLCFHNNGYTPLTGSMSFNHDPLMTYSSSTVPFTSQAGNVINYTFSNLYPGQTFSTIVYMTEPAAGNTLNHYLTVNAGDAFGGQLAYSDSLIQVVSCSYDPNDKAVYPAGIGPMNYVSMDQRLQYLIRFQNTGNDTAFKVVVVDALDGSFDFSTITILGSSHSVQSELSPSGQLTFTFDNILLPDSNVNEPGSHGFVLYSIKGRASNPDPTSVNNTAYIFFDQNAPVQTNTTLTTFSDNYLGLDDLVSNSVISIAPNPFNGEARITCESCQGEYILQLTDLVGKVVQTQRVSGSNWTISKGSLTQGTYVLEARSAKTGQSNRLKVTVY